MNNNHAYKKKYEEIDISRPKLFVLYLGLGDSLHAIRRTGSLSIKNMNIIKYFSLKKSF